VTNVALLLATMEPSIELWKPAGGDSAHHQKPESVSRFGLSMVELDVYRWSIERGHLYMQTTGHA
jgi:hypothetical protein